MERDSTHKRLVSELVIELARFMTKVMVLPSEKCILGHRMVRISSKSVDLFDDIAVPKVPVLF